MAFTKRVKEAAANISLYCPPEAVPLKFLNHGVRGACLRQTGTKFIKDFSVYLSVTSASVVIPYNE